MQCQFGLGVSFLLLLPSVVTVFLVLDAVVSPSVVTLLLVVIVLFLPV